MSAKIVSHEIFLLLRVSRLHAGDNFAWSPACFTRLSILRLYFSPGETTRAHSFYPTPTKILLLSFASYIEGDSSFKTLGTRTEQNRTGRSRSDQIRAERNGRGGTGKQSKAQDGKEQHRTEKTTKRQNRAEQSKTERNSIEQKIKTHAQSNRTERTRSDRIKKRVWREGTGGV